MPRTTCRRPRSPRTAPPLPRRSSSIRASPCGSGGASRDRPSGPRRDRNGARPPRQNGRPSRTSRRRTDSPDRRRDRPHARPFGRRSAPLVEWHRSPRLPSPRFPARARVEVPRVARHSPCVVPWPSLVLSRSLRPAIQRARTAPPRLRAPTIRPPVRPIARLPAAVLPLPALRAPLFLASVLRAPLARRRDLGVRTGRHHALPVHARDRRSRAWTPGVSRLRAAGRGRRALRTPPGSRGTAAVPAPPPSRGDSASRGRGTRA